MPTHIHLHFHSLYYLCGVYSMTYTVGISVRHFHYVYVPIHAWVILYVQVTHGYWNIYENISFTCSYTG